MLIRVAVCRSGGAWGAVRPVLAVGPFLRAAPFFPFFPLVPFFPGLLLELFEDARLDLLGTCDQVTMSRKGRASEREEERQYGDDVVGDGLRGCMPELLPMRVAGRSQAPGDNATHRPRRAHRTRL